MAPEELPTLIEQHIRDIPDYPQEGVLFKDITPLLANPTAFAAVVDAFTTRHKGEEIDVVVGIEARGFILAAPIAYSLGAAFVPVRKKGKLPAETLRATYDLEYGSETVEMHVDAITPGSRVLVVDDVLATGGTAAAAAKLVGKAGGTVVGLSFLLELGFLNGRDKLTGMRPHILVTV